MLGFMAVVTNASMITFVGDFGTAQRPQSLYAEDGPAGGCAACAYGCRLILWLSSPLHAQTLETPG